MECSQARNGDALTVHLSGKFTFGDSDEFRSIIKELSDGLKSVVFDLSGVDFIDSAGLGMLLIARDEADKNNVHLTLANAQGHIEKMFKVSKFETLFTIT